MMDCAVGNVVKEVVTFNIGIMILISCKYIDGAFSFIVEIFLPKFYYFFIR